MLPDQHAPVAGRQAHTKPSLPTPPRPLKGAAPAPPKSRLRARQPRAATFRIPRTEPAYPTRRSANMG
jgi:hypothetical protein